MFDQCKPISVVRQWGDEVVDAKEECTGDLVGAVDSKRHRSMMDEQRQERKNYVAFR